MLDPPARPLIDGFGRQIEYVRLSVTDRCDLRCRYCMAETMAFLPRRDLLTLEEMLCLADLLIARGVRKIRLTGGEPLVRKGVGDLIEWLGRRLGLGLEELTLTTNGTQLDRFADRMAASGVKRVNVSLDTRNPDTFSYLTRGGDVRQVLQGIAAARQAGLKVKINMVALAGLNEHEIPEMVRWCGENGHDLTMIETMPVGEIDEDRTQHYLPLDRVRERLAGEFRLRSSHHSSGGPARYDDLPDLGIRVGFITPLSRNFCSSCNRIRVSATGTIFGCLGHDQNVEIRDALRTVGVSAAEALLDQLVAGKPERHFFDLSTPVPAVERHMNVTGG